MTNKETLYIPGMFVSISSVIILFFLIEIHNIYLYLFFVTLSIFFLANRFSRHKSTTLFIFVCLVTVLFIDQYLFDLIIYYKN